ncbi:MAG: IreB family regulatory phosphoprotein [Bacilli bacterium]
MKKRGDILDNTMVFKVDELENYMITETLSSVNNALSEKGYNGIDQIVGYLMSGDLGYISSYKDSRKKIGRLEREKIIEALLKYYLKDVQ